MVINTKVIGRKINDKEKENILFLMEHSMKDNGLMTRKMEKVSSLGEKEQLMMECGKIINVRAKELINMLMVMCIWVIGNMIFKTGEAFINFKMAIFMKVLTLKVNVLGKVSLSMLMVINILEPLKKGIKKALVLFFGLMEILTSAIGNKTNKQVKVS